MRFDLSSCASPPAQATRTPDRGLRYSCPVSLLLAALAHVGPSVWQQWALANNIGFFSSCREAAFVAKSVGGKKKINKPFPLNAK